MASCSDFSIFHLAIPKEKQKEKNLHVEAVRTRYVCGFCFMWHFLSLPQYKNQRKEKKFLAS